MPESTEVAQGLARMPTEGPEEDGMSAIAEELVDIALSQTGGADFERFAHGLMAEFTGDRYLPLGGVHDGGADGLLADYVSETEGKPTAFVQTSIELDVAGKVRRTVARLRDVGRTVAVLTHISPHSVAKFDLLEETLSRELGVLVRIRERGFIRTYVNQSTRQQDNFRMHLGPYLEYLMQLGNTQLPTRSQHIQNPAVVVFLRQEAERANGSRDLLDSTADALALWALQGTDPDKGIRMSAAEIHGKIVEVLPNATSFLPMTTLQPRLQSLSTKRDGKRQINHHRSDNTYVLPYETRRGLDAENIEDEALSLRVREKFEYRAFEVEPTLEPRTVANTALTAIQLAFENRGLEFAAFLEGQSADEPRGRTPDLREPLHSAVEQFASAGNADALRSAAFDVIRGAIYAGDADEREYLRRLAKTYSIFFTLRQDPAIVKYFEDMSASLRLYVGTDIIVQAISEYYLPAQNRAATIMLEMAASAGAQLILTENVLEEIASNLRSADHEYHNYYEKIERHLTPVMIHEVPKILLRAYLYNLGKPGGPQSWQGFVNNFCSYGQLHQPRGEDEIRLYLLAKFNMSFVSSAELESTADAQDVSALTAKLLPGKRNQWPLAHNDALMICAVFGERVARGELASPSPFGFSTWWLTTESGVLGATGELRQKHRGAAYLMRPEFLLNFFALAPKASQVRDSFRSVFPSTLGITLSRRMDTQAMRELMRELSDAEDLDEARRLAVMATCVDKLKADFARRYSVEVATDVAPDPAFS